MSASVPSRIIAAALAASLLFGATAASGATRVPTTSQINPWAALSVFGTQSSQDGLCAATAGGAPQAGQPGCVLPALDAPPAPPATQATPVPTGAMLYPGEAGVPPLLLALAAIATGVFLLAMNDDDAVDQPVSPG